MLNLFRLSSIPFCCFPLGWNLNSWVLARRRRLLVLGWCLIVPGPLILEQGALRLLIPRCHQATSLCLLTWLLLHWASGLQGSCHFPRRHLQAFTGSLSSPLYFRQGSGHRDVGLFSQVTLRSMLSAPGTHKVCMYPMEPHYVGPWHFCVATIF